MKAVSFALAAIYVLHHVSEGRNISPFGAIQNIEGNQNSRPNVVMQSVILGKKKQVQKMSSDEDSDRVLMKLTKMLCSCESEENEKEYESNESEEDKCINKLINLIEEMKRKKKRKYKKIDLEESDQNQRNLLEKRNKKLKRKKDKDVETYDDQLKTRKKKFNDYDDFEFYKTKKSKKIEDDYPEFEDLSKFKKNYYKQKRRKEIYDDYCDEEEIEDRDLPTEIDKIRKKNRDGRLFRWSEPGSYKYSDRCCYPYERPRYKRYPTFEKLNRNSEDQLRKKRMMQNKKLYRSRRKMSEEWPGDGKREIIPQDVLYIPNFGSSEITSPSKAE